MRLVDNRPRPYSTLRDGQIVWVTPEEQAAGKPKRSHLETDDEVRERLRIYWKSATYWDPLPDLRNIGGPGLDLILRARGQPPRQIVDD